MTYYKTWQEALKVFIEQFGHNYEDGYNLVVEFEQYLGRNKNGAYFLIMRSN